MKLLITGGAGFIGANFVHYWVKNYPTDSLVVLDKLTYAGTKDSLHDIQDKISFVQGDICDEQLVSELMRGIDTVVHFAAESHVDRSIQEPLVFVKSNTLGTAVLLNAARIKGVKRFHHISTDEVFGMLPVDSDIEWTEETPYDPTSPYSASKAGADYLARAFYKTYGMHVTLSNCANNYGPFHHPEKLLPLAITNILEETGKKIPIYGKGDQIREWLHVEDHCRAIDLILRGGKPGETYLVSPDKPHPSNLEVIQTLLRLMGKDEDLIEFVPDRPGHDTKYANDSTKLRTELGWKPNVSFEEGLKQTIEWYRNNQAWWKKIKSGEYKEYYEKQYQSVKHQV
ncbi:MAG TPA: dTDP-glucose 4,6-dehydratase [Patescibacteria group bacterium]|nr:dTDP-glucose 4,6-dehydratase [Patescibacteria group bacterium]